MIRLQRAILKPTSGPAARAHFEKTVRNRVPLNDCLPLVTAAEGDALRAVAEKGGLRFWGAAPGERMQHVSKWERVMPGDVIFFARDGGIFCWAFVTETLRSAPLAAKLWGTTETKNGSRQTWELMSAISAPREVELPYTTLNRLIGRSERAVVQEFSVLSETASEGLLQALDLQDNSYQPGMTVEDYKAKIVTPEFDSTEREVITQQRREQGFLRKMLFGNELSSLCDLCGREYPTSLLVAAHIKKRALCTEEEKLDFESVVMSNCRFGCDELFERGLIGVSPEGNIVVSPELGGGGAAEEYALRSFSQHPLAIWQAKPGARGYFADHFKSVFRR